MKNGFLIRHASNHAMMWQSCVAVNANCKIILVQYFMNPGKTEKFWSNKGDVLLF